jgi:hypothetical protein
VDPQLSALAFEERLAGHLPTAPLVRPLVHLGKKFVEEGAVVDPMREMPRLVILRDPVLVEILSASEENKRNIRKIQEEIQDMGKHRPGPG